MTTVQLKRFVRIISLYLVLIALKDCGLKWEKRNFLIRFFAEDRYVFSNRLVCFYIILNIKINLMCKRQRDGGIISKVFETFFFCENWKAGEGGRVLGAPGGGGGYHIIS